jgi:hypothetical protein
MGLHGKRMGNTGLDYIAWLVDDFVNMVMTNTDLEVRCCGRVHKAALYRSARPNIRMIKIGQ